MAVPSDERDLELLFLPPNLPLACAWSQISSSIFVVSSSAFYLMCHYEPINELCHPSFIFPFLLRNF